MDIHPVNHTDPAPWQAEKLAEHARTIAQQLHMLELIFDHIEHAAIVTDAEGRITHFNKPYGRFLGVDPKDMIGKLAMEVIEGTRMHLVAKTGKPEINFIQRIHGHELVVQRIPIFEDGKVVAVYAQATFLDVSDVGQLAKKLSALESKVKQYKTELSSLREARYNVENIRGMNPAIATLKQKAEKAAATDLPVLITGESGTGKELFAQAIHQSSRRSSAPCIRVNCAALPKDLFEAEIFGYASGAFTGASAGGKPGKFELAKGGTVFLDEVGELPLDLQPKLLRVLEEKEFERVGSNSVIKANFRLVTATNRNLEEEVKSQRFREDLYYRLNVIHLHIPPLRERTEDIVPLAGYFLSKIADKTGVPAYHLSPQAERVLQSYPWPGNIRELQNVLERTVYTLEGATIEATDLPISLTPQTARRSTIKEQTLRVAVEHAERDAIRQALEITKNNKVRAAQILGIHRTILYRKMKIYGFPVDGL